MQSQEDLVALSSAAGSPEPLGPSPTVNGVNFALFSANATAVSLCLFDKDNTPIRELPMENTGMACFCGMHACLVTFLTSECIGLLSVVW